jgi:hypothetical protein
MAKLTLPLKGEFFFAIKNGSKVEEFRLCTPYWERRLANRVYQTIELTHGYPSRSDQARRHVVPWRGIRKTSVVHPLFGANPVNVFAIRVAPTDRAEWTNRYAARLEATALTRFPDAAQAAELAAQSMTQQFADPECWPEPEAAADQAAAEKH